MEILLGLKGDIEEDTILPNSYLNLHPKRKGAATGPPFRKTEDQKTHSKMIPQLYELTLRSSAH